MECCWLSLKCLQNFLDDFGYDLVYRESCHSKFKSLLPLNEIQGWQVYTNDCDEIEQRILSVMETMNMCSANFLLYQMYRNILW